MIGFSFQLISCIFGVLRDLLRIVEQICERASIVYLPVRCTKTKSQFDRNHSAVRFVCNVGHCAAILCHSVSLSLLFCTRCSTTTAVLHLFFLSVFCGMCKQYTKHKLNENVFIVRIQSNRLGFSSMILQNIKCACVYSSNYVNLYIKPFSYRPEGKENRGKNQRFIRRIKNYTWKCNVLSL